MKPTHFIFAMIALCGPFPFASGANPPTENPGAPQQQAPVSPPAAGAGTPQSPAGPPPGLTGTPSIATLGSVPLSQATYDVSQQNLLTGDWDGFRKMLADDGVSVTPTYIGEVFGNPSGGRRQGDIYDGLLNVALDADFGQMNKALTDTALHVNVLEIHGTSLSQKYTGDFSDTSNIAGYNTLRLQELWLQKWFWAKRLSLKVGNMAVDAEYFQSASASLFINGTFGAFTFMAENVPNAPVYPLASPGVRLQFLPDPKFYVMAGVYGQDIYSDPGTNNQNGTRFALAGGTSGMLIMSEAGYLLNQASDDHGLQGTYRIGSFVHTDDTPTFAGGGGGADYGVYGVMDQQLYVQGSRIVSFFVRSGGAPSNTNFVDYYIEGGFNFAAFIPGRDNDVAGIAVARSHVSSDYSAAQVLAGNRPSTAETVIEATYKVQLAPFWSLQPDAQYIVTPSGVQGSHNATVLGLRTTVAF